MRFPEDKVVSGTYDLVVTNPGGLSVTIPGAITARYKPFDLLVSGGYSPWISLYDATYTGTIMPGTFFPVSLDSRASIYFIKQRFGYFGAEVDAGFRVMWAPEAGSTLDAEIGSFGLAADYKLPFLTKFAVAAKLGGGLSLSRYGLTYSAGNGAEQYSIDPYIFGALSLQFYIAKKIFLEAGIEWMHTFALDFVEGGIMPFFMAGMQF